MQRENFGSGAPWEDIVGYSRVVKVGNQIEVAGTTAVKDGEVVFKGDAAGQTRFILERIEHFLVKAGAGLKDVVRTRMYVTDISQWEAIGKVHGEFFGTIKPAATMVECAALVDPEQLIEIEVTAIIKD